MKTKIFLLYLLAFLVLWACIPSNGTDDDPFDENVLIEGIAIVETNNKKIPFIFQHKDGRNVSILDTDENGSYDGLVYKDKEHNAIISFNETTYLPTKAETSEGEIILFNYHSDNTRLNLAILRGETIDYFLDIEVDVSLLSELTSKSAINKSSKNLTAIEVIKKASKIISVVAGAVACDASILATVASGGILAPSILAACGSFALTVSTIIVDASDIAVEKNIYKGAGLLALGLDTISCLKADVANCITAAVDLTTEIIDQIRGLTNSIPDENIDAATGIIEIGQTSSTLTLIGELNFGNVELGKTDEFFFTIRNNSDKEVIISYINHPEGYFLNWTSGKIPANGSQLIGVIFSPIKIKEYKGNIVVDNDLDSENNKIAVLGNGISSSANTISLVGALEFNNIAIGTSESRFFEILNNSLNDEVTVSSIEIEDVPTQYFKIVNWSSGAIGPGVKQEVEVVFTPNDTINYSGNIKVVNDIDQINNTLPISGKGDQITRVMVLIGNLDFGYVNVGETVTRFLSIENHGLNNNINVSNIEVPDGYSVSPNTLEILPGEFDEIEISFSPTEEKEYEGELIIVNDIDQINNTLPVSGSGSEVEDTGAGNVNLQIISGNNQIGHIEGQSLPERLKVKVTDDLGNPKKSFKINFKVTQGNGGLGYSKFSVVEVLTGFEGIAEISWTLDGQSETQTVEAFTNTASVIFNATLDLSPKVVLGISFLDCGGKEPLDYAGMGIVLLPDGTIRFTGRNYEHQNQDLVSSSYTLEEHNTISLSYTLEVSNFFTGSNYTEKVIVTDAKWDDYDAYKGGVVQILRTGDIEYDCSGSATVYEN